MTKDGLALRREYNWVGSPAVFYLLIPLLFAVVFALMRSGLAALMSVPNGLLFWVALMVPSWLAAHTLAAVAHVVLRPWRPPLWLLCSIGAVGQALIFSPAYRAFHRWAEDYLVTAGRFEGRWPLPAFTLDYVAHLVWAMGPGLTLLIAANYFYDRFLGVPRLRYGEVASALPRGGPEPAPQKSGFTSVASPSPSPAPEATAGVAIATVTPAATVTSKQRPPILRQSRLPDAAVVYALSAEEHYVRIFSDAGNDMVRYRFSDALDEFAEFAEGMQVHRSWWVRTDRARHWHLRGRLFELEFDQGLRVPISLAFREAALMKAPPDVRAKARRSARRGAGLVSDAERVSGT